MFSTCLFLCHDLLFANLSYSNKHIQYISFYLHIFQSPWWHKQMNQNEKSHTSVAPLLSLPLCLTFTLKQIVSSKVHVLTHTRTHTHTHTHNVMGTHTIQQLALVLLSGRFQTVLPTLRAGSFNTQQPAHTNKPSRINPPKYYSYSFSVFVFQWNAFNTSSPFDGHFSKTLKIPELWILDSASALHYFETFFNQIDVEVNPKAWPSDNHICKQCKKCPCSLCAAFCSTSL